MMLSALWRILLVKRHRECQILLVKNQFHLKWHIILSGTPNDTDSQEQ